MMTVEKRHEVVVKPPCDGRAEGDVILNRHKPKTPTLEGRGHEDWHCWRSVSTFAAAMRLDHASSGRAELHDGFAEHPKKRNSQGAI